MELRIGLLVSGTDIRMMNGLANWLAEARLGRYSAQKEEAFYARALDGVYGSVQVQLGLPDWRLWPGKEVLYVGRDVHMATDAMAWACQSVDVLLMPHVLESCADPSRVLAEAYRILKPEGVLVLTGFNPHSLWRFSRLFDGRGLPEINNCLPLPVLKKKVRAVGFSIQSGSFMVYVPPFENKRLLNVCRFMEAAGDRWWPHGAAVYGLVMVKRVTGVRPLPEYEYKADVEGEMALGLANVSVPVKISEHASE